MTRTQIAITTQFNVTLQQIDRCDKVVDYGRRKCFYQVESQSQPDMTYHVEWNGKLTCTCKGAQAGYTCWHMRAALASEELRKTALRSRQAEQAEVEKTEAYKLEQMMHELEESQAELDAYLAEVDRRAAQERRQHGALNYNRGFSLLK